MFYGIGYYFFMSYSLTAQARTITGRKVKSLRDNKLVPAVLYGFEVEQQFLQIPEQTFRKTYIEAGENQVVDLIVEGSKKPVSVLIREIQIDPIRREVIHADLFAIDITKPIDVQVPIEFTGEAPAVKATGGTLVKKLDELSVRCLPKDFAKFIEVPLGNLVTLEDAITVGDVKVPAGWTVLNDANGMVATVVPLKVETFDVKPADAEAAVIGAANEAVDKEKAAADAKKEGGDAKKPEGKSEKK